MVGIGLFVYLKRQRFYLVICKDIIYAEMIQALVKGVANSPISF